MFAEAGRPVSLDAGIVDRAGRSGAELHAGRRVSKTSIIFVGSDVHNETMRGEARELASLPSSQQR